MDHGEKENNRGANLYVLVKEKHALMVSLMHLNLHAGG